MIDDYPGREYYRVTEDFADMNMIGPSVVIDIVAGRGNQVTDNSIIEKFIGDVR